MVSPVLYERRHSGGFMVSEDEDHRSRDQVTLLQQLPPGSPATPTTGTTSGGSLTGATYYVKVTYVGPFGETLASGEATQIIATNNLLTVTSPAAATDATGYNVYASIATGTETLQTAAPIAIGTNWTQPTSGLSGSAVTPPTFSPNVILPAGLVLGQTSVGTSAAYLANGGNTGNFTCGTVTVGAGTAEGVYTIEFIAATVFNVQAPSGVEYEGHTGVAFAQGGPGFTITAGGTAAVAGDGATITLAANANVNLYGPLNLLAADGTQNPVAILFNEKDASQANTKVTVIARAAQVNGSELIYPAAATAAQIAAVNAALQAIGIVVR